MIGVVHRIHSIRVGRSLPSWSQIRCLSSVSAGASLRNENCNMNARAASVPTQISEPYGMVTIPKGFKVPVPKALQIADGNYAGYLTGVLALAVRGASGVFVLGWRPTSQRNELWPGTLGILRDGTSVTDTCRRPVQPVQVFDNEADPQCMLVREACSMLDLTMDVLPRDSALGGHAEQALLQDGGAQFRDVESAINHLFDAYGPGRGKVPLRLRGPLAIATAKLASKLRGNAGRDLCAGARPDRHQLRPLTLWGYENSPFVRPVREALSSLGLRHTLVNCARGSANRDAMFRRTGRFQVPYLEDPNTGVAMYESGPMVQYLYDVYSTASATAPATTADTGTASLGTSVAGSAVDAATRVA